LTEGQQPPALRQWVAALTQEGFDPEGGTIAFTPGDPNAEVTQLGATTRVVLTITAEDVFDVPTAALDAAKAQGDSAVLALLARTPEKGDNQTTILSWVALDEGSSIVGQGGSAEPDPSC
jgi:hypothetical protein